MKQTPRARLSLVPSQAVFSEQGFTAPLEEPESPMTTPCQYDYDPQCSTKLIDRASGHRHAPILILVTPHAQLLQELLTLGYLTGKAKEDAEIWNRPFRAVI